MNEPSNVLRGVLHPDGTLELAGRPTLPAGEVEVTIRPATSEAPKETLLEFIRRTRAEQEASGAVFRTKEEIDADLADDRDWGEDRLDELHGQTEPVRPVLPPRPTEVANRPVIQAIAGEDWLECLQRIRAGREAAGDSFRTNEEIDKYVEEIRDWGEERIEEARGRDRAKTPRDEPE